MNSVREASNRNDSYSYNSAPWLFILKNFLKYDCKMIVKNSVYNSKGFCVLFLSERNLL